MWRAKLVAQSQRCGDQEIDELLGFLEKSLQLQKDLFIVGI